MPEEREAVAHSSMGEEEVVGRVCAKEQPASRMAVAEEEALEYMRVPQAWKMVAEVVVEESWLVWEELA